MRVQKNAPEIKQVLTQLSDSVQGMKNSVDSYLKNIEDPLVLNPFKSPGLASLSTGGGFDASVFWRKIGIDRMISNALLNDREIIVGQQPEKLNGNALQYWKSMINESMLEWLRALISECPVIQFRNWTETEEASLFMDLLFTQIIKPLKKRDHEFIFQLGDPLGRYAFELDEFMDIVEDYSSYGNVTLMLEQTEADRLWNLLNGSDDTPIESGNHLRQFRDKYQFLFKTSRTDVLIVFYDNDITVFARDWQFELQGRVLNRLDQSGKSRTFFNAGYQLGLLLNFEIPNCIVFGLAVSRMSFGNTRYITGSDGLLSCISEWIKEADSSSNIKWTNETENTLIINNGLMKTTKLQV